MTISLHAALVPNWLQILGAAKGWIDQAAASEVRESELLRARLADDMFPFAYQVKNMRAHSKGAIAGVRQGVFSPKVDEPLPSSFAQLHEVLDDAIAFCEGLDESDFADLSSKDMRFEFGDFSVPFTAEQFLLTFSQTNFFFHAVTAYDILRAKGVDLGKRDYLGALRIKRG